MLFLLLTLLFSLPSSAAADPSGDFRRSALLIPQKMRALGYRKLGGFNPDQLIAKMSRVEVRLVSQLDHDTDWGSSANLRNSAHWRREGNKAVIYVNGPFWQKTAQKHKPMLSLHEHLGALGYRDDQFACSTALWLLTDTQARQTLDRTELEQVEQIVQKACRFAGGSTGVTGGGDEFNVYTKMKMVEDGLKAVKRSRTRAEREKGLGQIGSAFSTQMEAIRGFRLKPKRDKNGVTESSRVIFIEGPAIESTIRVWLDGKPLARDPKNGWTYDRRDPHRIHLHGRALKNGLGNNSVLFTRAR